MKKSLLIAAIIGLFAVSCGTKESSMSTNNTDSTAMDSSAQRSPSTTMDTVTTTTANPDSTRVTDSVAASPTNR
ncbi:cytochrome C551 [Chryseobacterium fluminis]|uniref:cytochrome C551 n=1 Tax=Chryseobacterium fluminis TaxID=2983606 RepID=UPI002255894B|nr:cytochrome C551 [Chryseobacterium sp. MMS21-Ot14]UZT99411.1 cytochrome C551 [Chryseobacterium sp. MMS21-Ot14]